jgi:nucleotidyltransferase AbiEii toxin of type IV toxin-antitoxin system
VTDGRSYGSPGAFRRALTDKLRALASTSRWTLPQLQRQMAYDRLLERLYLVDEGWIIKGATALLARDIGVRGTIDIDLYREVARETAETDLRRAAALDIGDWFRFEIGPPRPHADTGGARLPVTALVGNTVWVQFHVDLVGTDLRMTGEPEDVPPLARVLMPDMEQHGYRVYPLVDHIADKVCAILERHGPTEAPSTRFRDLVDLVAIVVAASVDAAPQMAALRSEAERRGLQLPKRFAAPDRALWEPGYAAEAGRSLLPMARTLDEALATVAPCLDPLLGGTARGRWDPRNGRWTS